MGDFTGGIHMTAHQMTTKAVAQPKRRLEVHRSTTVRLASQRGAAQGFLTHIGAEAIPHQLCRREANAIHSHAVAKGQRGKRSAAPNHHRPCTTLDPSL